MAKKPFRWLWDFGDNTTSNEKNVSHHVYAEPGNYTVSRTIYYEDGSEETITKEVYITVAAEEASVSVGYPSVNAFCVVTSADSDGTTNIASVTRLGGDDFPLNFKNMQPINITDSNGRRRHVGFDSKSRQLYELITDHGGDRPLVWKDKVSADLTGGSAYYAYMKTRGATGSLQRYWLEPESVNVYTKHSVPERRVNSVIDSETLLPAGATITVSLFIDEKETTEVTTEPIEVPKHEIGFDKRVLGNVVQTGIRIDGAPMIITGLTENLIAKDQLDGPHNRNQDETDIQEELAFMQYWLTRGSYNIDRVSALTVAEVSGAYPNYGPDVRSDSGVVLSSELQVQLINVTAGIFLLWEHTDNPTGFTILHTDGDWNMVRFDGTLLILPAGKYFDIRGYDTVSFYDTDKAIAYLYDDVVNSGGINTLPEWV